MSTGLHALHVIVNCAGFFFCKDCFMSCVHADDAGNLESKHASGNQRLKKGPFMQRSHHGLSYFHLNDVLINVVAVVLTRHAVIDVILAQVMFTEERKNMPHG